MVARIVVDKRGNVIAAIRHEAKLQGIRWGLRRHGARHDVFELGSLTIPIPRHRVIARETVRAIFRECEPMLGKEWWLR